MALTLRAFDGSRGDYQAFAGIFNAELAIKHETAQSLTERDNATKNAGKIIYRQVAELDGRMVGFAEARELMRYPKPGRLMATAAVLPALQRQGIGSRLYQTVETIAREAGTTEIIASINSRLAHGVAFALKFGYEEIDREWELHADPRLLDDALLEQRVSRLQQQGIIIRSLTALKASTPDWFEHIYRLSNALDGDIPGLFEFVDPSPEQFRQTEIDIPEARHDALFVALKEGQWLGMTEIRCSEASEYPLFQELTGTLKAYRGLGIATTLKLKGFEWARDNGYTVIRTWSNSFNKPMLALNEKLGFVRQAADIAFKKTL